MEGGIKNAHEKFNQKTLRERLTFKRRIKSHLLELLGAHRILHVFRIRVKLSLFSKSKKNIMKYK